MPFSLKNLLSFLPFRRKREERAQFECDRLEFATGQVPISYYRQILGRIYKTTKDSQRFRVLSIKHFKKGNMAQHEFIIIIVMDRDTGRRYYFRIEHGPDRAARASGSSTSLPAASMESLSPPCLEDASRTSSLVLSQEVPAYNEIQWLPDGNICRAGEYSMATLTFPNQASPSSSSIVQLFDIAILADILHDKFPFILRDHSCYYMAGAIIDVLRHVHEHAQFEVADKVPE
ncbi:hypothetical protein C0995_011346, partial [Termitomyces sp. Mi166